MGTRGELVQRLPPADETRRRRDAGEGGERPGPAASSTRMILGANTIAVHGLRAGADRTSGVASGRIKLLMVRGGSVRIPSGGGFVDLHDGQGLLVIGTASVRMMPSSDGEIIAVGMPVDALPGLSLTRNSAIAIEDAALMRPIGAFAHTVHGGDPLDALSRERFAGILRDLVLVAVRRAIAGIASPAPSLHHRATAILQRRFAEAGLTPARVASELHVSLRQLEREFQPSGRTIRQEIRRIRVLAAVALLQGDRSAELTIDAIAVRVGLSNGSSLARATAAEGLPSPSRVRARGSGGGVPSRAHT